MILKIFQNFRIEVIIVKFSLKTKTFSILCVLALLIFGSCTVCFADENETVEEVKTGTLTVSVPVEGMNYKLYKIGAYTSNKYQLDENFSKYQVDLYSDTAAYTLSSMIANDDTVEVYAQAKTDKDFKATFTDLPEAVYLLVGESVLDGHIRYTSLPSLVTVPTYENNNTLYDIVINDKYENTSYKDVSVLKVWEGDNDKVRPKSIDVQLLENGKVYETVTLSESNNWAYSWNMLAETSTWTVKEVDVPKDYVISISSSPVNKDTLSFVIKNTYNVQETTQPTTKPVENIPQTGQTWWPVSVLFGSGVCFVLVGILRRKKN